MTSAGFVALTDSVGFKPLSMSVETALPVALVLLSAEGPPTATMIAPFVRGGGLAREIQLPVTS